ncbi:MAG: hypothetical protein IJ651_07010 [Bacteroidales bacterium]|nr:hypothetical protein [Bacteroidales bacterium]
MNKKELLSYEAPTTNALELRFEGLVCISPKYGASGFAGDSLGLDDDDYDFGSF